MWFACDRFCFPVVEWCMPILHPAYYLFFWWRTTVLGCLNKASKNVSVQLFVWMQVFLSLGPVAGPVLGVNLVSSQRSCHFTLSNCPVCFSFSVLFESNLETLNRPCLFMSLSPGGFGVTVVGVVGHKPFPSLLHLWGTSDLNWEGSSVIRWDWVSGCLWTSDHLSSLSIFLQIIAHSVT
jgi:hypothetical protein